MKQQKGGGQTPPATPGGERRRWWFRVGAVVLVPLLVLGALELGLRLAGYGYSTSFFKPFQIEGKDYFVENDRFGWRFFAPELARSPAPIRFLARKPPGTCRIFILGESAALGDPRPAYGAGRYLQALLEERYPERSFEVVCTAMTAINSHALVPIARECARHEGDIWIIYMGNNEMVGPFGAATVFGPQAPGRMMVWLDLTLQGTRVGQLLTAWGRKLKRRPAQAWAGMEMFTQSRVPAGDARRARVYANFRANLGSILRAGFGSGAKIVLSTVSVNLRDSPPFASLPGARLTAEDQAAGDRLLKAGAAAIAQTNLADAAQLLAQAASLDPQRADLQFYLAGCLLGLTNAVAARQHFERACDLDALPFRADSTINSALDEAGRRYAGSELLFFDATKVLGAGSLVGIPGAESFYEHVHFNFDGNYRLARAWADEVALLLDRMPPAPRTTVTAQTSQPPTALAETGESAAMVTNVLTPDKPPVLLSRPGEALALHQWASREACERRLGLTDWNRAAVLEDMLRRLTQPPLSTQSNNGRRWEALHLELAQLRQRLDSAAAGQARELYLEALRRAPDDERLHENFAEFLEAIGDLAQGQAQWERVRELIPQHHLAYFQTGRLLLRQAKLVEAKTRLQQAVQLRPDLGEGWLELGNIDALQGKADLAIPKYQRAQQLTPQDPRPCYHLGKALSKLGRPVEAMQQLRQAVQLRPAFWEAHYALGEELAFIGMVQDARSEFEQTIRIKPDYAMAHLNLGVALAQEGKMENAIKELKEAQRLDPQNPLPAQYLQKVQSPGPGPAKPQAEK